MPRCTRVGTPLRSGFIIRDHARSFLLWQMRHRYFTSCTSTCIRTRYMQRKVYLQIQHADSARLVFGSSLHLNTSSSQQRPAAGVPALQRASQIPPASSSLWFSHQFHLQREIPQSGALERGPSTCTLFGVSSSLRWPLRSTRLSPQASPPSIPLHPPYSLKALTTQGQSRDHGGFSCTCSTITSRYRRNLAQSIFSNSKD